MLVLGRGGAALASAPPARRSRVGHHELPGRGAVLAAGALLGLLLWHVAGNVGGDGFFHLARIQKLLAFGDLSLGSANEFPDGGLHPGYAFPLWHGSSRSSRRSRARTRSTSSSRPDGARAARGRARATRRAWALFRRVVPAAAAAAAGVALVAMAPGSGGALTALALPATASRQLLVPAALALALETTRRPTSRLVALAAALAGARGRPPDLRDLPVDPVRRLPRRPLAVGAARRRAGGLALGALVVPAALFFRGCCR